MFESSILACFSVYLFMTKRFNTVVLEVVISVNDLNLLHNVNHVFTILTSVTQKLSPMRKTFSIGTCVKDRVAMI